MLRKLYEGYILMLFWCCYHAHSVGPDGHNHVHTKETLKLASTYLTKYGYVNHEKFRIQDRDELHKVFMDGISRFQRFANLKVTGEMDEATVEQMKKARCGVQDPPISSIVTRRKRYAIQGSRWYKKMLTWRLDKHARTLKRDTVRRVISKAAALWSNAADIDIKETQGNDVDMWITFASGYHGDGRSFDGPNGTVGHAYFPASSASISGDIHFDNDENFVYKAPGGYDLLQAVVHEMGHALGLEHSDIKDAIMYPWQEYGKYKKNLELNVDDVRGVMRLYGKKKAKAKPTPVPLKYCPRSFITAVFYYKPYNLYVAITDNEQMYFIFDDGRIRSGPHPSTRYFPKHRIPGRIDAAFNTQKIDPRYEQTVIFAGESYYIYIGFTFKSGPHSIHSRYEKDGITKTPLEIVLPDWVRKVEAAFTWINGDTYLFSGRWYWRYGYAEKRFRRGYPRVTSAVWKGVSGFRVHTAFTMIDGTHALMLNNNIFPLEKDKKKVVDGFPIYMGKSKWIQCKYPA